MFSTYVTKFELSKTFPPVGGSLLGDNEGANRDEIVNNDPGELVWGANEKPLAFPAINQTPNFYTYDFDAEHNVGAFTKEFESWDTNPWSLSSNPVYTDLGFYKGNMFGLMDVRVFADVCQPNSTGVILIDSAEYNQNLSAWINWGAAPGVFDLRGAAAADVDRRVEWIRMNINHECGHGTHMVHYRSANGVNANDDDGHPHAPDWDVMQSGVWLTDQADPRDYDPDARRYDGSSAPQLRLHTNH